MKKADIKVGSHYIARVNGKLTVVRVDDMYVSELAMNGNRLQRRYGITNLRTGRHLTFRSARKFRREAKAGKKS